MTVTAALTGTMDASVVALLRLCLVLMLGALPFALFGLTVGFQAGTNASTAILNAVLLPSAVLSGLWIPLQVLPDFIGELAPFLPTYHLAQIAVAQLTGQPVLDHVLILSGMTVVAAALAALSYRHTRP